MSRPGLAVIVITAISVAVAVQAFSPSYSNIQSADAQPRLPNNSVRSETIVDGQVQTQDLADDAVTTEKIRDGEVKVDDLDPSIGVGGGAIELDIVRRSNLITIPSGEARGAAVTCQTGEIATGGGFLTPFSHDVKVTQSAPHEPSAGHGWSAAGRNDGSSESRLTVYVLCAKMVVE